MKNDGRQDEERCTFCSKSRRQVRNLIAGPPKVYICNECIELCNTILVEHGAAEDPGSGGGKEALLNFPCQAELFMMFAQFLFRFFPLRDIADKGDIPLAVFERHLIEGDFDDDLLDDAIDMLVD